MASSTNVESVGAIPNDLSQFSAGPTSRADAALAILKSEPLSAEQIRTLQELANNYQSRPDPQMVSPQPSRIPGISALRALAASVAEGRRAAEDRKREEYERKIARKSAAMAEDIIKKLPGMLEKAAKSGEFSALVLGWKREDGKRKEDIVIGAQKIVIEHCKAIGLNTSYRPTVDWSHGYLRDGLYPPYERPGRDGEIDRCRDLGSGNLYVHL